ncbi:MAG: 3-phosphoglycerate dehydrogenase family protein [Clostridia bacterium]|nr:3-phosphoglycerate dehydrogenase family protein [Clostridia bacterium]
MKNIKLMNKIASVGTDVFSRAKYTVGDNVDNADAIMVRSAALHDLEFNPELLAIARCGAGVNNIPIDRCTDAGIVVFNTPGANANAVKELTICALALASRNIVGGIEWAKTLETDVAKSVEKGKSAFAGVEFAGKTLGVVGLGAIGGLVANAATHLGMNVIGYDPYITVDAAWNLSRSIGHAATLDEVFEKADYITLHVPAVAANIGMICAANIAKMKDGVRIINLARADLAVAADVKAAIASGKVAAYVTDFPTEETVGVPGIVNIPHLGASTEEAEDNCAVMAAKQLDAYLTTGNIRNSVNFPTVEIPYSGQTRVCVLHANVPAVISKISGIFSDRGINIENLTNKSRGNNACTLLELSRSISDIEEDDVMKQIAEINGVWRVRVI